MAYRYNRNGNISQTRGVHYYNIITALQEVRKFLENRGIFETMQDSYYEFAIDSFKYQISCCVGKKKDDAFSDFTKFLPRKYKTRFKKALNDKSVLTKYLEPLLSVKNSSDKRHKIIAIFGVKFKIKRKLKK